MFSYTVMVIDLIDPVDFPYCGQHGQHSQQPCADRSAGKISVTPPTNPKTLTEVNASRVPELGYGGKNLVKLALPSSATATYARSESSAVCASGAWSTHIFHSARKAAISRPTTLIALVLNTLCQFWRACFKAKSHTLIFKVLKFFFRASSHVPKFAFILTDTTTFSSTTRESCCGRHSYYDFFHEKYSNPIIQSNFVKDTFSDNPIVTEWQNLLNRWRPVTQVLLGFYLGHA